MHTLKILNTHDTKKILSTLKEQWGFCEKLNYAFVVNAKGKVHAVTREFARVIDLKLRIDTIGFYFGTWNSDGFRLSIEGSQIIGPLAKKNVVLLDEKEIVDWAKGIDIEKETDCTGYVILRKEDDFIGCGRIKEGRILNYIPRNRRLREVNRITSGETAED
ncbi:hypothetical protein COT47_01765 [Candidatus Woesearchaeota archaeon CG08_land_8_20_14_0_20_43_7]|nr:MAG: hypothetical protein COT47_01765 [Candidatus Woesearchaeota archaeon CG08_land_8_20_14_0_20_43_7]